MLKTEIKKLQVIHDEILFLGQSVLSLNEEILQKLEHCFTGNPCELNKIEQMPKQERFQRIDKIDNLIINVFALYTPEAKDLRELIAFLKITNEFDRIANSGRSFIRDFPKYLFDGVDKDIILEYAVPLQKTSVNAISNALEIIVSQDESQVKQLYKAAVVEESKNDELYQIIEKNLLRKIDNNIQLSKEYQEIMAALRRLEKIADRALSIAILMCYARLGGEISKI